MEITSIKAFLEYDQRIRQRTERVVQCIPPEQIEWTYQKGKFTLGDLIRHLAALERYMFAENIQGNPSVYPGHGRELADGYDNTVAFMKKMHEETVSIISSLDTADLQKKCITPGGSPITVWKWLRAMIEHEIHHRGQIYLYLGMLGVQTPPLYGLTAEQVFARSQRS